MATARRAPEGAAIKKDKSAKNLIPAVSYSMADIMNNPSGVRTRSGDGKYKGGRGGGAAPSNHKGRVTHAQHRAKNPRQPARKRQELDLTPLQAQPSQYGNASSRSRLVMEVSRWRRATDAERKLLASEWLLGPSAQDWLAQPVARYEDYRGYLRARAQDAMRAVILGKPIFKDNVSRPAATKILGVWQDGAGRAAPKVASPAKHPVQTTAPKPTPPRQAPAQPSRPQAPPPPPSAPVALATRIPKSERGTVAKALEAAFREAGMSQDEKRTYAATFKERHGILVTLD
jgi:hypothetical protein